MIELKHIRKVYGDNVILKDINVTVNEGDVVSIIGPSGCGKSTLLNCFNVLERPTSGQVIFEGVDLMDKKTDVKKYRRHIGMVFQSFNLFNNMTVLENVMIPQMDLLGATRQQACDKAIEYLRLVGMSERIFHYPSQLSGGQKQRAAIARTLALEPQLILLDEPTSALDPTMVGEVEYVIKKLSKMGRTMLIVTHSMSLAKEISNRIFYIDEGGIYEEGTTEQIFEHPQREKTRRFILRLKCLEFEINSRDCDLPDAFMKIQEYGDKLAMERSKINKMQLMFEEFCVQTLLNSIKGEPKIKAVYEYNEDSETVTLTVTHNGEPILGSDNMDEITRKLIEGMSKDITLKEIIE